MLIFFALISITACQQQNASVMDHIVRLEKLIQDELVKQKAIISSLARQVSMQQLYTEEMTRSSMNSGLKTMRLETTGTREYHSNKFASSKIAAIHDHSNYMRTIGMGEVVAVLNGVEFRTRHNDYSLKMAHKTDTTFGASEDIPFPDVPPEVLNKISVDEQIAEMREWFKAWKNQDYTKRDYRKYFKAVLCYMEGMWTLPNPSGKLDEPFNSERHQIAANSWFDLQDKLKFSVITGRKDNGENLAFLPTTIIDMDENGYPVYAQWNYNIRCHPLQNDVPLKRFRPHDDLANRVARGKTIEGYASGREARFQLYPDLTFYGVFKQEHFVSGETFLDKLMVQIPGKDNYPANILDDSFNLTAYHIDAKMPANKSDASAFPKPLNVGYYHRLFKTFGADAMGLTSKSRGFADSNLYVALNSQQKIPAAKMTLCKPPPVCSPANEKAGKCSRNAKETCTRFEQRASYAFPLEIIYLTPLLNWNPFNITHFARDYLPEEVNRHNGTKRNGGRTQQLAYAGTSNAKFFRTPAALFSTAKVDSDAADTSRDSVGILDSNQTLRMVVATGTRIILPDIPGVGAMRLRYPIAPIADAGNLIYKEVDALKDLVLRRTKYSKLFSDRTANVNGSIDEIYNFELNVAQKDPPGAHTHTFEVTESKIKEMKAGKSITVTTSTDSGHDHELVISYSSNRRSDGRLDEGLSIQECDGRKKTCWDGHYRTACVDCVSGFPNPA